MSTTQRHKFTVEVEIDLSPPPDGWHAVVADEPALRIYGASRSEALAKAKALALRVIADRIDEDKPR